jgi:hypothetical protein
MLGRFEGIGLGDTVLLEKDDTARRQEQFSALVASHSRLVYRAGHRRRRAPSCHAAATPG